MFLTILFLVFLFILVFYVFKFDKNKKTDNSYNNQSQKSSNPISNNASTNHLTNNYNKTTSNVVAPTPRIEPTYSYEDVSVCIITTDIIDYDKIELRDKIRFKQESTNKYDENAITINVNDYKLGYVYKGKMQDMINDYLNKNYRIFATISKINEVENSIKYDIDFYPNVEETDIEFTYEKDDYKKFKLIGNTNAEMQDNIYVMAVGDKVSVSYDVDKEKYLATSDFFEIGYMPKTFDKFIDDFPNSSLEGFIENISENDNDKYVVSVCISKQ